MYCLNLFHYHASYYVPLSVLVYNDAPLYMYLCEYLYILIMLLLFIIIYITYYALTIYNSYDNFNLSYCNLSI